MSIRLPGRSGFFRRPEHQNTLLHQPSNTKKRSPQKRTIDNVVLSVSLMLSCFCTLLRILDQYAIFQNFQKGDIDVDLVYLGSIGIPLE